MSARTIGAICLGPTANEQGGHYLFHFQPASAYAGTNGPIFPCQLTSLIVYLILPNNKVCPAISPLLIDSVLRSLMVKIMLMTIMTVITVLMQLPLILMMTWTITTDDDDDNDASAIMDVPADVGDPSINSHRDGATIAGVDDAYLDLEANEGDAVTLPDVDAENESVDADNDDNDASLLESAHDDNVSIDDDSTTDSDGDMEDADNAEPVGTAGVDNAISEDMDEQYCTHNHDISL